MADLKSTVITGDLSVSGQANIESGAVVQGGDLTLYQPGTGNSPALILRRGTLSDNYNDWQIQDRGGYLQFDQRGNGSTAFSNVAILQSTGLIVPQVTVSSAPTANMQVANKKYVDDAIAGGVSFQSTQLILAYPSWSNNILDITCTGMTSSAMVWVSPAGVSYDQLWRTYGVRCTAQATDRLTFTCTNTPVSPDNITVNVVWAT